MIYVECRPFCTRNNLIIGYVLRKVLLLKDGFKLTNLFLSIVYMVGLENK